MRRALSNSPWSRGKRATGNVEVAPVRDLSEVKADVLVVGGGLAGCWAAIRARQLGAQVVLADKGPAGWTGQSKFASGDIKCLLPGDDLDQWVQEIVVGGDYLNDQRWIELVLTETYPLVQQMESFGCRFEKEDGELRREYGRGRITKQAIINAARMMKAMREAAEDLGVNVLDRVFISRLLADGNRVRGAVGVHTREGTPHLFSSPSIVLAAGGCTFRGLYYGHHFSTGDAFALAYRAGAQLMNFEFVGCNSCHRDYPTTGMSRLVAFGGVFRNAPGEAFMEQHDPLRKDRTQLTSLAIAMAKEVRAGRGPIYFDLTAISPREYELSRKIIPWNFMLLDKAGLDIRRDKMEWVPAFMGPSATSSGIKTDFQLRSTLDGLYACGDAWASTLNGAGMGFGGLNLALCSVSGHRAGEEAAQYAKTVSPVAPAQAAVQDALAATRAAMERKSGPGSAELLLQLQRALVPYDVLILRSETKLQEALAKVERLQGEAGQLVAPDPHELIKVLELDNMLLVAEMVLRSALMRRESRGLHYREDYPQKDNATWLQWTGLEREDGQMKLWPEPIPLDAFKYVKPAD